jgi:hypothetical protein
VAEPDGCTAGWEAANKDKTSSAEVVTEAELEVLLMACSNRAPTGVRNRAVTQAVPVGPPAIDLFAPGRAAHVPACAGDQPSGAPPCAPARGGRVPPYAHALGDPPSRDQSPSHAPILKDFGSPLPSVSPSGPSPCCRRHRIGCGTTAARIGACASRESSLSMPWRDIHGPRDARYCLGNVGDAFWGMLGVSVWGRWRWAKRRSVCGLSRRATGGSR